MNETLFQVETPVGYVANLGRRNWERHEARRPELQGQLFGVRTTVAAPDIVVHTDDGCDHFYARGHGKGALAHHYLHVLVREFTFADRVEHTIVSAWFTRIIEEGVMLWPREP